MKKLLIISLISTMSVASAMANAELLLQKKGFDKKWISELTERGEPRWYAGDELKWIGQPVGGIFAGQVYLGGDGRLWNWDIFNKRMMDPGGPGDRFYNTPMAPEKYRPVDSGFLLDFGNQAVLLDGRDFDSVRFRGEYPISRVDMSDRSVPVQVELEAFSPFIPTQSELSGFPATILCYKISNPTKHPVEFKFGAWLENASNREAVAARTRVPVASKITGGVLLGATAPASVHSGNRADMPFADFEKGYGRWKAEGEAFGTEPFPFSQLASYQKVTGQHGDALVNSHNTRVTEGQSAAADKLVGSLTSPAFKVERNFITFTVAGGNHDERGVGGGRTAVDLLVDGELIATKTGRQSNAHAPVAFDLSKYQGRQAVIRVVDTHSGAWGHIQVDHFVQTDDPASDSSGPAPDAGTMALTFLGREGDPIISAALPKSWQKVFDKHKQSQPSEGAGVLQSEQITLMPGESVEIRVAVCWHFENGQVGSGFSKFLSRREYQRNYYSKHFDDAAAVADALGKQHEDLVAATRLWRDTWYDSSLPFWLLDRTFLPINSLATAACMRMHDTEQESHDSRIYFWEGVYLGEGTCTHVTHYEQGFGRVFPDAARAQRTVTDYGIAWDDTLGYVRYRAEWNVGQHFGIPHAIDGHAGTILRTYREHTTSADNSFLTGVWPKVKRATRFMIDQDAGRGFFETRVPEKDRNTEPDGILAGPQYNTLDKVWDGTIPWTSGLYLASLRAAAEMAREMGDMGFAGECSRIAEAGRINLSRAAFSKEFGYYIQLPDEQTKYINSNDGCHIDQMLGDYWTGQVGLEPVFPAQEGTLALARLFDHNFYRALGDYRKKTTIKVDRYYADDDEPGFLMCTFPHGGEEQAAPKGTTGWHALVLGYFSECMTGFSYQAAADMISRGLVTEGLAICRGIHERYAEAADRRNPFNEVEYGNHYTRAMSSYGAFVSASGFTYHGPHGVMGFAPKIGAVNFKSAFIASEGWGSYRQLIGQDGFEAQLKVKWGMLNLQAFNVMVPSSMTVAEATLNGRPVAFTQTGGNVHIDFGRMKECSAGDVVDIKLK